VHMTHIEVRFVISLPQRPAEFTLGETSRSSADLFCSPGTSLDAGALECQRQLISRTRPLIKQLAIVGSAIIKAA
jgi:hypothetical protein